MSLGRFSSLRRRDRTSVSSGRSTAARAAPCSRRRRLSEVVRPATGSAGRPGCRSRLVRHQVDVDVTRQPGDPGPDPFSGQERLPAAAAAGTDHDLGGVLRPREVEERDRHVVAHDLMPGATHRLGETALPADFAGIDPGQAVAPDYVYGQKVRAGRSGGDPDRTAQQRLPLGATGQRDDDPLAGLPRLVDPVGGAVALQSLVHPLGHPQQGELPQRRKVADPEVVGQGRVDPLRGVDVAVSHPSLQRLGRDVDDLDLLGAPHHLVRDRLALRRPH